MSKQTAVDLFHDRIIEQLAGKKSITTNTVAKIWQECKAVEREQLVDAWYDGLDRLSAENGHKFYEKTYGKEAGCE